MSNGITGDAMHRNLQSALDLRWRRQEMLATNVAHADTPGYQPTDLEFEGVLKTAMSDGHGDLARTRRGHMNADGNTHVAEALKRTVERPDVTDTLDGNGVDMDQEMARATDNSMKYQATLEIVRRRMGLLRQALTEMSRT